MNELIPKAEPAAGRSGRKALAALGAALFVGAALCTSRGLSPDPVAARAGGAQDDRPAAPTPRAVAAANAFLDALDAGQRAKALYEFGSAKRANWSNLPVTFVPRNGVRLGDLTREQRDKAMAVVAAVL